MFMAQTGVCSLMAFQFLSLVYEARCTNLKVMEIVVICGHSLALTSMA